MRLYSNHIALFIVFSLLAGVINGDIAVTEEDKDASLSNCVLYVHTHTGALRCTYCKAGYALDNTLGQCLSQDRCWTLGKVYVQYYNMQYECVSIQSVACSSQVYCQCPPGYTQLGTTCVTYSECLAGNRFYTRTIYDHDSASCCVEEGTLCPSFRCRCRGGFNVNVNEDCRCRLKNCRRCAENNFEACFECQDGYFLVEALQTCVPCMEGCDMCHTADTCEDCKEGYVWSAEQGACLPCPANCERCDDPNSCLKCNIDYVGPLCEKKCDVLFPGCWECAADGSKCVRCWFESVTSSGGCMTSSDEESSGDGALLLTSRDASTIAAFITLIFSIILLL